MAIPAFLLLCIFLPLPFSLCSTRPGCPTHCGDLEVRFPFGIGVGSNCSIDPSFDIRCNYSTNPPKAYLIQDVYARGAYSADMDLEVTKISKSQVRVKKLLLSKSCYDLGDPENGNKTTGHDIIIDLEGTPYTLSEDNWVTSVGCDDSVTTGVNTYKSSGCLSLCIENTAGNKGSCSTDGGDGYNPFKGCCHTDVHKGWNSLQVFLSDLHQRTGRRRLYRCSYAFIEEKGRNQFSYRLDGLQNMTIFLDENMGLKNTQFVLDWRIGSQNCSEARRNSSAFACKENSYCVDYDNDVGTGGYLCQCAKGYIGNPYLTGVAGCQDIDECERENTSTCAFVCTNTLGGYKCSCPKGYYGDGKRHGIGCHKLSIRSKIINVSIGVASGIGFLLLLAICFLSYKAFKRKKSKNLRNKFFKRNGGLLLQQQHQTSEGSTLEKTKLFSAKELEKATDQFNENRVLGQGGQGTVYKGMLSDGKIVAIKKSKLINENQLEQFINEVVILSQINHRNVVKLLGCCLETEVPLLVYEFIPNGTLFDLIHDGHVEFPISWSMRLKIAADVAGALTYLHSASSIPIYHRDIKSSNILLDEKYIAKVTDFGTSRLVAVDQTHLTTLVKGTFGYLDPEYFQSNQFTEKSDVYSFGVVLVELLTGQRPISVDKAQEERSLTARFLLAVETNDLGTILDARVLEEGRSEEVNAVARLAHKCLHFKGKMRPTMKKVAIELECIHMCQTSSMVDAQSQEKILDETNDVLLSEIKYTSTTSDYNATTSSTNTHPFMLETV